VTDLFIGAFSVQREVLFSKRTCWWYGRLLRKLLHEIDAHVSI